MDITSIVKKGDINDFYEIEDEIGRGTSQVFLAYCKETERNFAVKVIETEGFEEVEMKYIYQELYSLRSLNHPSIVKFIEAFKDEDDQKVYIVAEFLEGESLNYTIAEHGYLEERRTAELLKPIADALRYMQKHHFAHRDLKVFILCS